MDLFDLVVEAGAEDLEQDDEAFMVTTSVEDFDTDFGLGVSYRIYRPVSDLQRRISVRFIARSAE